MLTKEQIAKALMSSQPASAGPDFYNQVMPGGVINAPSMLSFQPQQGAMDASGMAQQAPPMTGNAAMQPMPPQMDASGAMQGNNPVSGTMGMQPPMAPVPMPQRPPQMDQAVIYTIRKGDTLSDLAKRFGTTVKALAQQNGIKNPDKIIAGRTLRI